MIRLPHDCYCSPLKVIPKEWNSPGLNKKTKAALVEKDWYIYYRFYDPLHKEQYKKGKLVIVKGMNLAPDYDTRLAFTNTIMADVLDKLVNQGYNPIQEKYNSPAPSNAYDIQPTTPLITALNKALQIAVMDAGTKKDIQNVINPLKKAADQLGLNLPVSTIKEKHIRLLLEQCGRNSERFTANTFNHYRKYLSILFAELEDIEAVEMNIIAGIKKQKVVTKVRKTLSKAERKKVNEHLRDKNPTFHRFLHIFFHSGARISELLLLKVKDVDLQRQQFKVTVKKGKSERETLRTIKDIALPMWQWLLLDGGPNDYVFSKNLVPGPVAINPIQVSRRWRNQVKNVLKIDSDFYALKHLATTQMVDLLSAADAAKHNAHTTTGTVTKVYDVRASQRTHERLKGLANKF